MTRARRVGILLAGLAVAALPTLATLVVIACGGGWYESVTVDVTAPATSDTTFSTGDPGIVRPTFTRHYLVLAYRQFTGRHGGVPTIAPVTYSEKTPARRWLDARDAVLGTKSPINEYELNAYRPLPEYRSFSNCLGAAWTTAVETLAARTQQFGAESRVVRDWLAAQDAVFSNCREAPPSMPAPPRPDATPLERADRAYQLAAAHFYAMQYDRAEALFRAIGEDRGSPWRPWGRYLAARTLLRRASLKATNAEAPILLARAERELQSIQNDASLAAMHDRARSLAGYIGAIARPVERLHEVSSRLSGATMSTQDLVDYQVLFDNHVYQNVKSTYADVPELEVLRANDDLTDWILVMQGWHEEARLRALSRWRATTSPAWLVATMWKLRADDAEVPEALEAASRVPRESPAFATLIFLRARLLLERNDKAGARQVLDTLPDPLDGPGTKRKAAVPYDTLNLLRGERLLLARTLPELLRYLPRWVVAKGGFWGGVEPWNEGDQDAMPRGLELDGAIVLDHRLPLALLARAVAMPEGGAAVGPPLARSAWTRAVLTGRQAAAEALAPVVARENPTMAQDLARWQKATGRDRHFAAIYTLLRHPGLAPNVANTDRDFFDHQRGNWWCAPSAYPQPTSGPPAGSMPRFEYFPYYRVVAMPDRFPEFLTDADRVALAEEQKALTLVGTAPNYLASEAVAWAKAEPKNPRVAEALALAVEGTRWGCGDDDTGARSREAFRTLQRLFPGSARARRTKYWYTGRD